MNGFIVEARLKDGDILYISNTSPIAWANNRKEAKIFEAFRYAKHELEDNFISLSATINNTNIGSIFILEYINDIEVGREKFI